MRRRLGTPWLEGLLCCLGCVQAQQGSCLLDATLLDDCAAGLAAVDGAFGMGPSPASVPRDAGLPACLQELMQHKLVFIETQDVVETTLALDNFRRACDCGRGAVFFRRGWDWGPALGAAGEPHERSCFIACTAGRHPMGGCRIATNTQRSTWLGPGRHAAACFASLPAQPALLPAPAPQRGARQGGRGHRL